MQTAAHLLLAGRWFGYKVVASANMITMTPPAQDPPPVASVRGPSTSGASTKRSSTRELPAVPDRTVKPFLWATESRLLTVMESFAH